MNSYDPSDWGGAALKAVSLARHGWEYVGNNKVRCVTCRTEIAVTNNGGKFSLWSEILRAYHIECR